MTPSVIPFAPGRTKYHSHGDKLYIANLVRYRQIRYSRRFRKCRTASEAQAYANRWAARATAILGAQS